MVLNDMEYIDVIQDMDKWPNIVNTILNIMRECRR
jgi:hypothetical protein